MEMKCWCFWLVGKESYADCWRVNSLLENLPQPANFSRNLASVSYTTDVFTVISGMRMKN